MVEVKVWGEFACFTRPENKVERVSYDVMTPSAARGVLEGIFWKPEFHYQIREIWVLNPIKHFSLLRNEVNLTASVRTAQNWAKSGGGYLADEDRAQRHALLLRGVAYIIRAEMHLAPHATDPLKKYTEIFERRVEKGQAHRMPYLGTREFSASFAPRADEQAIEVNDDLGRMLFDLTYTPKKGGAVKYRQHNGDGGMWVEGEAKPRFFSARLEQGILKIPPELYEGVR
jgi:CRISPR-associated protein Cas5d